MKHSDATRHKRILYSSLIAAVLSTNLPAAQATPQLSSLEDRLSLQLQLGLLDHTKTSGTYIKNSDDKSRSITTQSTHYGLSSRVGLGLGYGMTENIQIALFTGFATHTNSAKLTIGSKNREDMSTQSREVQILPAIRYVTGEGGQRFYVGAAAGFERDRTKASSDSSNAVSKRAVLGGQIGVYHFVHERVSLEPALELYYIKGSTKTTQSDENETGLHRNDNGDRHDKGVRLMLTLGMSLWSAENSDITPPVASPPTDEQLPEHDPTSASSETQYMATRTDDLSFRLLGNPQRTGSEAKVEITTHSIEDPPLCDVTLLSDDPPQKLDFTWWLDGADETGPLQTGLGRARVELLARWLTHNPSLSVCKRLYAVNAKMRAELEAALERFKSEAVSAGTRQPE